MERAGYRGVSFGAAARFRLAHEKMLDPRLDTLPAAARRLWRELDDTPSEFVLYGGTALALRLGHRRSEDFDFFSSREFDPVRLLSEVPYLRDAEVVRQDANTLTCVVDREEPVRTSFFGGLLLNRVEDPESVCERSIRVASLADLAATKAHVIQLRASARDYLDLDALFRLTEVTPTQALAAATAVFGSQFNPLLTLKALTFFGEGDLTQIPETVRRRVHDAVASVDPDGLPTLRSRKGVVPESAP